MKYLNADAGFRIRCSGRTRAGCRALTQGQRGPTGAFDEASKSAARKKLFNNISKDYDELNDKLSFGQHRVWKRMAVQWTGVQPGQAALDVCCGSGDLALLLAKAVGPSGSVIGLDFAQDMLDYASTRPVLRDNACAVSWVQGDALDLPLEDNSFAAVTIGYGLRNVADIPQALREVRRVLQPGSKAAILDFNNASNPVVDGVQGLFLERLVVPAARERGLASEYEYLRPSIKSFPTGETQKELALQAGFADAVHYELSFGLMGCLVVRKPVLALP